eukprot:5329712-Pyramimonas_sp.AAC.1
MRRYNTFYSFTGARGSIASTYEPTEVLVSSPASNTANLPTLGDVRLCIHVSTKDPGCNEALADSILRGYCLCVRDRMQKNGTRLANMIQG